jgi:ribosomal protein S27AE
MKRILAIIALAAAAVLETLGLLFLIAATEQARRFPTALALLALGTLPLAWGILTLRRLAQTSPEALATGTLALARRLGGEVTVAHVQAEFRISAALAQETLDKLAAAGQARPESRGGRTVYAVAGLQQSLVVRQCPYCGSTFPVREARRQCPNCGASLELSKQ